MKKILSIALFTLLLTANQDISEDLNTTTEDTNITKNEDVNLTDDELIAEIMRLDENIENLDKLEKTVDKLSNQIGIEK